MRIVRTLRVSRLLLCIALAGSLATASGCGDSNPVPTSGSDAPKDGEHGKSEQDARLKAYGTAGTPKTQVKRR
jgi:hypothetical protein